MCYTFQEVYFLPVVASTTYWLISAKILLKTFVCVTKCFQCCNLLLQCSSQRIQNKTKHIFNFRYILSLFCSFFLSICLFIFSVEWNGNKDDHIFLFLSCSLYQIYVLSHIFGEIFVMNEWMNEWNHRIFGPLNKQSQTKSCWKAILKC